MYDLLILQLTVSVYKLFECPSYFIITIIMVIMMTTMTVTTAAAIKCFT